jgi:DNA repair and recombination protein RAD52
MSFALPNLQDTSSVLDSAQTSVLLDVKPSISDLNATKLSDVAGIQSKLNMRLGPEYLSHRPAPGGGPKLTYVEGWRIIMLANEVFGYNGWSSSLVKLETDYIDMHGEERRFSCGISAVVRVTLKDGTSHEDIGYGSAENLKSKGAALDKVRITQIKHDNCTHICFL